jgi:hypothetical protein
MSVMSSATREKVNTTKRHELDAQSEPKSFPNQFTMVIPATIVRRLVFFSQSTVRGRMSCHA